METKKTDAVVEVADNGYIMRCGDLLLVYPNKMGNGYRDMVSELMSDLDMLIDAGEYTKIRVKVEVEPLNDNDNDNENERKND